VDWRAPFAATGLSREKSRAKRRARWLAEIVAPETTTSWVAPKMPKPPPRDGRKRVIDSW